MHAGLEGSDWLSDKQKPTVEPIGLLRAQSLIAANQLPRREGSWTRVALSELIIEVGCDMSQEVAPAVICVSSC